MQRQLFPALQEEIGPLGEKDRMFVDFLALLPDEPSLRVPDPVGRGLRSRNRG
jgi:hypothetical protein